MSDEVINKAITFIKEKCKEHSVLLILHGGEPLFNGLQKIKYVINALSDVKNLKITITTNLIYNLTDEHIQVFKSFVNMDNKPLISTSWDYKIRFTDKQKDLWENNVKSLIANSFNVAPIICITSYILNLSPKDLLLYFKKLGIIRLNFERLTLTGNAIQNNYLKPKNIDVDAWLYKAYLESKKLNLNVSIFDNLEEAIYNHNLVGCKKRNCQEEVITINPDGKIAGCPNCSDKTYGTLEYKDEKLYKDLIAKEQLKENSCYICDYYKYCNGECYQLSWDETGCPGLKSIIKYIINHEKNIN